MKPNEYLEALLDENKLTNDSDEVADMRRRRDAVEVTLRKAFAKPSIKYGGSKAKGTMVRVSYDLDLTCYFECDDSEAGETLEEIHANVKKALVDDGYSVAEKTSAIRIHSRDADFHVDVVPGRYFDSNKDDVWLHRTQGSKERLKTNLDVHVDHVTSSGVQDAICLMKLWRDRNALIEFRTFALELITIKTLDGSSKKDLDQQLRLVLGELKEHAHDITIEDPANPTGNDLSDLLPDGLRRSLKNAASSSLATADRDGWEAVFGPLKQDDEKKSAALHAAVASTAAPSKPWSAG